MARLSTKSQGQVQVEDGYLIALAKQGDTTPTTASSAATTASSGSRPRRTSWPAATRTTSSRRASSASTRRSATSASDRESSFRNFAELCITRQIITAVKTATRNKHTPLNQYVSFSSTPPRRGDGEPTLDEVIPGPSVHDPVNQVISSEELRSLVGVPVDGALRARVARPGALPRRPQLRADRRAPGLRHEDRRQRAAAGQAQGGGAPAHPRRPALGRPRTAAPGAPAYDPGS